MNEPTEKQLQSLKLTEWLDQLQQESWQLELIISGFVIFLLLAVLQPLLDFQEFISAVNRQSLTKAILLGLSYSIILISYFILLANLLLHVIFRGLWISTIGLRYVSADINYEQLNLPGRFERFLRRRMGTFDEYIERLERICSVLFGFTFLLIFASLGLGGYLALLVGGQGVLRALMGLDFLEPTPGFGLDDLFVLVVLLMGLIYMIDFLTLGWIKRRRWLNRVYYPVYRVMSLVTFANLYRPLYYNLIDNRFGQRLAYLVIPIILLVIVVMSWEPSSDPFMPYVGETIGSKDGDWIHSNAYESNATSLDLNWPSIPEPVVTGHYLPVFLPYIPATHDKDLGVVCPDLRPYRSSDFKLRGIISIGNSETGEGEPDQILDCFRQLWRLSINDSTYQDVPWRFYYHTQRQQYGLFARIPVADLPATEHLLKLERYTSVEDSINWRPNTSIYFWKE